MTIKLEAGKFFAFCDDNAQCAYNGLFERSASAQTQEVLSIDTTPPATEGDALHAGEDGSKTKKQSPTAGLTKIEKQQLDRFCAQLVKDGWVVRTDRSRELGLMTICRNHNPATVHPRPPPEYDW